MKKSFTFLLTSLAALTGAAGLAYAGKIETPMLFTGAGNQLVCIATNASSSSVHVTVRILGNVKPDAVDTCNLPASDKDGCQVFLNDSAGRCRISISGKTNTEVFGLVRGVLFNRTTSPPFTMETAVEAR